jgi:hypothetical protein
MATWYNGKDETLVSANPTAADVYQDSVATGGDGFGSPSFDTGGDGKHNVEDVEVKLIHRFRLKFGVFRAVGHHVKTVTKPNVTFAEVEVPKLNSKVYFAGRKTQDQATVELDDSLDGAVSRAAQTQLQKQANFDNNYHAKSGAAYFFNMTAEELAGDGTALMAWYYNKCVVMTCDFGSLDYSDDAGTATVNLGIRYANFTTWMPEFTYGEAVDDSTDDSNANTSNAFASA